STLYYPTPATLAIHPQPNQNFILTTTTTPAQTIRQFITHTLHALTQSPIAYPNPIYLHYQTTPTQLFLFISFNHALIDGLEMVSFLNQFLHTTAHHNIYLTHHPPLSPLQHNHHTYYTTDLTIPDNTPPADQYHRIVYQLAHQHQARQINQLTALRLPHHKVTLTPVRYRPAWPDFRRHNHHQLNISKQTRNRYTRYFDTYHHAPHLSAALYSLLTHPHLSRYRPHVLGHLQISAVFMPTTQYILFPFAHTYQPHAIALCQRPQPHTNTLRIAGVIYQP
ncbi:MAG TPA: hypothetical protein VLL52_23135, partial [Anaerolineae bacterium]|nr:hypothetical protein [Anaerolineae bacterium]